MSNSNTSISNEPAVIEFVYDAAFCFDDLPNNQPTQRTSTEQQPPRVSWPTWHHAAKAPVPFHEDVFWMVLERWILEAPTIIPPVAKVEIIHEAGGAGVTENPHGFDRRPTPSSPSQPFDSEREQHLLESRTPFRTIRRRLLPKRLKKDVAMEEQLYFVRSLHSPTSPATATTATLTARSTRDTDAKATSHVIFAPIISLESMSAPTSAPTTTGISLGEGHHDDEIATMSRTLPFYYPKVRGFRYGYIPDLEEDEADKEDYHEDANQDGCEDGHYEYEQDQDHGPEPEQEQEQRDDIAGTKPKKTTPKARIMSKRAGWITLDLFLAGDEGEFTDKMQYAFKELFKKLYKWGVNTTKGFTKSKVQHDIMVPKELYLKTYARLKERHAQKWVQSWPEKTDPRKFVFEDIAIASWLVALWQLERDRLVSLTEQEDEKEQGIKKQTFVDLGCGNGLLTHILNEEGHQGTGIDIASRKVWGIYGPETRLEARTVIPNETKFENVDWIIGNHADELAPWIPIIAMRSKPLTRFAVIPCCFFDLNGSRYQFPKGNPEGKYKAYQDYICSIIETCGYELQSEILRIPSTKNVALVGMAMMATNKKRKRGDSEQQQPQEQKQDVVAAMTREGVAPELLETGEETGEESSCNYEEMVNDLIRRSGVFVARISDRDKQELQRSKQAAKWLARKNVQDGDEESVNATQKR
ncbi:tRNA methyltransferase 44 [Mortierella claussenii]|nr:tRNA methyltransferase 44 [Mortierella claussenii]